MKAIRRTENGLSIDLERGEADLLRALPTELVAMLNAEDPSRGPLHKLFPSYMKTEDDRGRETHAFMNQELKAIRLQRFKALDDLFASVPHEGGALSLTFDQAEQWLAALTELRVFLADRVGIEDESWSKNLDPRNPPSREAAIYLYLSGVQSAILHDGFGIDQPTVT